MTTLVAPADYLTVRAVIRSDVDESVLPDETIGMDAFAGAAEREVLSIDPLALSRTGPAYAGVRLAAALITAARLVTTIPVVTRESFTSQSYQAEPYDPTERAQSLYWQALQELANVLGRTTSQLARAFTFDQAIGGRGDLSLSLSTAPLAERMRGSGGSSIIGPF